MAWRTRRACRKIGGSLSDFLHRQADGTPTRPTFPYHPAPFCYYREKGLVSSLAGVPEVGGASPSRPVPRTRPAIAQAASVTAAALCSRDRKRWPSPAAARSRSISGFEAFRPMGACVHLPVPPLTSRSSSRSHFRSPFPHHDRRSVAQAPRLDRRGSSRGAFHGRGALLRRAQRHVPALEPAASRSPTPGTSSSVSRSVILAGWSSPGAALPGGLDPGCR